MDLNQFKTEWSRMSIKVDSLQEENRRIKDMIARKRCTSTRDRLMRQLKRMSILCFVVPWPIIFNTSHLFGNVFIVMYLLFFLTMGSLIHAQYRMLDKIDLSTMNFKEALKACIRFKRFRLRSHIAGYIMGAIMVVNIMLTAYRLESQPMIIGCWAGLVIGMAIGLKLDYRQRCLIRQLSDSLSESLNDDGPVVAGR